MMINNNLTTSIANTSKVNGDAVTISVLRKALDQQAATASQLLNSLPVPQSGAATPSGNPRIGVHINTTA